MSYLLEYEARNSPFRRDVSDAIGFRIVTDRGYMTDETRSYIKVFISSKHVNEREITMLGPYPGRLTLQEAARLFAMEMHTDLPLEISYGT
jgi:hypothetical protein